MTLEEKLDIALGLAETTGQSNTGPTQATKGPTLGATKGSHSKDKRNKTTHGQKPVPDED